MTAKRIFVLMACAVPAFAANAVYISQTSAGANDGSSCANAKAASYFNTAGNWSSTPTGIQIGPDTTVHLCGTFTVGSSTNIITAQGNGSSGHPVIILFDVGAILQAPDFGSGNAAIILDNHSYITVDGGGTGNAAKGTFSPNGIIQATLSGTSGAACIGGACTQNLGGTGVSGTTTDHIVIKNLKIIDMYLRTSFSDQAPDWATYYCIHASPSSNLTIDNNYLDQSGEIIAPNGDNLLITNNYIANTNHGISIGGGSTSFSNTIIAGNHFGDMVSWDAGTPFPYHHDGIHVFPGGPGFYLSIYIYNNVFDGDIGASAPTAWLYMEAACCTGGTAWVFNNYATSNPYRSSPAMFGPYGVSTLNFVNNTIVGNGYTGGGVGCDLSNNGNTIARAQNNICGTQSYGWNVQSGVTISGTGAMDFNSYIDGSALGNSDNLSSAGSNTQSLVTYRSIAITGAATHDANSQIQTLANYKLNSNGTLQSGSLAIGAGANLFNTCTGQASPGLGDLCNDASGVARPSSAAWDAGAFQFQAPSTASGVCSGSACSVFR